MAATQLVDEQLKRLASLCDLDADVLASFRKELLEVAQTHLARLSASSSASAPAEGESKRKGGKRAPKAKPTKISAKNGYHFFVAAKMAEVKSAGVEAKARMKQIGDLWKATAEADRAPFKEMATKYNEYVATECKTAGWEDRRDDIVARANQLATGGKIDVTSVPDDETATVATAAVSVATPAPAPVPAQAAPKARAKAKAK